MSLSIFSLRTHGVVKKRDVDLLARKSSERDEFLKEGMGEYVMEEIYHGNNFVIMAGIVYRKNYMGGAIIGSYVSLVCSNFRHDEMV